MGGVRTPLVRAALPQRKLLSSVAVQDAVAAVRHSCLLSVGGRLMVLGKFIGNRWVGGLCRRYYWCTVACPPLPLVPFALRRPRNAHLSAVGELWR